MTKTIKVAVIGAGFAGQAHAFGFRNASMAASAEIKVELAYIADPNLPLAEKTAARYGFSKAVADIDEVINSDVDAISVALPNFLHEEVLPKVLASGKHVFAEKPIGRTLGESQSLLALAEKTKAVTGVGFSFRRLPGLAAVAQAVADGLIGNVHTARVWYNADYAADPKGALSWRYSSEQAGAGALLDIGSHAIDALHFVAGKVKTVTSANLRTVIVERPKPVAGAIGHGGSDSTDFGPVTNDDVAQLSVILENGALAQIGLSRIAHGQPNSLGIEVFGTRGSASFDSMAGTDFQIYQHDAGNSAFNGSRRVITGPQHPHFADVAAMPATGVGTAYAEAFIAEIQEFLVAIQKGTKMATDFKTAEQMMKVVDAALKSNATKSPVDLEL
ncbi:MAG: hypothetical protein RI933_757 [Actinomycetota bacterium]|jgi:predicted dehydrogenase